MASRTKRRNTDPAVFGRANRRIPDKATRWLIPLGLMILVWLAFGHAIRNEFVGYDDGDYVYENPNITRGLTLSGIGWAFTHVHAANWHPLTTISHMLDCQLYGLQPWGHHLTNILLHATAAVLLFFALQQLTSVVAAPLCRGGSSRTGIAKHGRRAPWLQFLKSTSERGRHSAVATPSGASQRRPYNNLWVCALVAAVFAVHPLRVESVAWVSERKDVLSGVFFMLTLLAYARYARSERFLTGRYLTVIVLFALGLMCKPTLVTLPFVLLLLDYWPLGRWQRAKVEGPRAESQGRSVVAALMPSAERRNKTSDIRQPPEPCNSWSVAGCLVLEKLPLFALSAASCVATVIAQKKVLEANLQMNFIERANNAFLSYAAYLGEMIWPAHLTVSHPYAEGYHKLPQVVASLILLLSISAICFLSRKKYPFLLTGWLWYIGMLVPMSGLVQVSTQARSDRYTYLAQVGVYIMVSWGAMALIKKWRPYRAPLFAVALALIIAFAVRSHAQTYYWRDTESLWRHAIDVSSYDYIAHDGLGYTLLRKGQINEAIAEYEKAIQIKPDYVQAHNNLGNVFMQNGQLDEAAAQYQKVLDIEPDDPQVHNNIGTLLLKQGRVDEAIDQYRKAVATRPQVAELHYNLGSALIVKGNWDDAINHLEVTLKIDPNYPEAHNKLGIAFGETGRINEAIGEFREALRLHHLYPQAHFNLGCMLAHIGQRQEGIAHLIEAVRLRPDYTEAKEQLRELGVPSSP